MKSSIPAGSLCLLISCCARYTPPPLEKTLSSHLARKAQDPGMSYDAAEERYLKNPGALRATSRYDLKPIMPFLMRAEW